MQSNFLPAECLWSFVNIGGGGGDEIFKGLVLSIQMNSQVNLLDYFLLPTLTISTRRVSIGAISSQMDKDCILSSPMSPGFVTHSIFQISSDKFTSLGQNCSPREFCWTRIWASDLKFQSHLFQVP